LTIWSLFSEPRQARGTEQALCAYVMLKSFSSCQWSTSQEGVTEHKKLNKASVLYPKGPLSGGREWRGLKMAACYDSAIGSAAAQWGWCCGWALEVRDKRHAEGNGVGIEGPAPYRHGGMKNPSATNAARLHCPCPERTQVSGES
jgi:hypothetical protein